MFLRIGALALSCLLFSCEKESSNGEETSGSGTDYQPTTAGSEWTYNSTTAGTYKIVSLGTDSLIDGKKFFKFDNNKVGRQYMSKIDGVYSAYATSLEGNKKITAVTLKDAPVGTTWTNMFNNQGTISNYTYKIISRDGDKTVNGKTYNNVIAVEYEATTQNPLGGGTLKFASGRTYTAKGIGGISASYKMDLFGIVMEDSTYLVSYNIK